ncbi:uncharacterized protein LOC143853808 [Tasmannia lanceolata]|uniref:uncharacterized protein LOC143853808 n=1 Tax=Tasmannia lanceolata TaxID=3420 RepID=UPI0040648D02
MADNTPSQAKIDDHFQQYQQQINEFRLLQSQQHGELVAMLKQLQFQSPATLLHRPTSEETSSGNSSEETVPNQTNFTKFIRMDVPKFDGTDPVGWIFKITQFFYYYGTPEDQRVAITSFHLEGPALAWFQWARSNNLIHSWKGFLDAICLRFGPSLSQNPKGALAKIHQKTSVEEYQSRFEDLSNTVSGLPESFLVSFFISGLKLELRRELQVLQPTSLLQTISFARIYEQKFADLRKSWKPGWINLVGGQGLLHLPPIPSVKPLALPAPPLRQLPIRTRQLSKEDMKQKLEKGLCYFCDDRYTPGHDCRRRLYHLYMLEEDPMDDQLVSTDALANDNSAEICFHAMVGQLNPRTIRVIGVSTHTSLHILIDRGSTHNFVQEKVAQSLHWPIMPTTPFKVLIGNGDSLLCTHLCSNAHISIPNHDFSLQPFVLPIKGADIVLGVQWLEELGPILADYKLSAMDFTWPGKPVKIVGTSELNPCPLQASHLKCLSKTDSIATCFQLICMDHHTNQPSLIDGGNNYIPADLPLPIPNVLHHFSKLFQEPKGLPPQRDSDHQIHLLPGSTPVNVQPYHYPHFQMNEIAKLVQEMLNNGIIVPSHSPYSSPVLFVTKKDNTWCFCVDYRALNSITIKDPFLIPPIDELMDELHGAMVFCQPQIEYLGHLVSGEGVQPDPDKIQAMQTWPHPTNLKQLRGFLGLTGYYRRFVHHSATLAAPLTNLLKKDAFSWSSEAQFAFDNIKDLMTKLLVLTLPNFSQEPSSDITCILPCQMQFTVSSPISDITPQLQQENISDPQLREIHDIISRGIAPPEFTRRNGLLFHNQRLFITSHSPLRSKIIFEFHNTPPGGHTGVLRHTSEFLQVSTGNKMRDDIKQFVQACLICQHTKYCATPSLGLLEPLPIPKNIWEAFAMDFITGLPPSNGYTTIFVVMDRLSKSAHLGTLPTSFNVVKWNGLLPADTSWENVSDLQKEYPHLNLEDKVPFQGVGNDSTHTQEGNEARAQEGKVNEESQQKQGQPVRERRITNKPKWLKDYMRN